MFFFKNVGRGREVLVVWLASTWLAAIEARALPSVTVAGYKFFVHYCTVDGLE